MSAAEVIAEIKRLPRSEREEVVSYVSSQQASLLENAAGAKNRVPFEEAAKSVLSKHRELLHKLAQ